MSGRAGRAGRTTGVGRRPGARMTAVSAAALAVVAVMSCAAEPSAPPGESEPPPPGATTSTGGAATPAELSPPPDPDPDCVDPRESYAPADDDPLAVPDGSAMARIVERGQLVVGVGQNTYLFGYRDLETGDLGGFDVALAREIAGVLLGDPDRVMFRALSSAERIPAVVDRDVDLVIRTMTMDCVRWREVAFSTEYFTAGQRVLVEVGSAVAGIEDLGGEKVCAVEGSTSLRNLAAIPGGPVPVSATNWTDCLVLLHQRQVAAISTDDTVLAGLAAQDPTVHVVGESFSHEPYGIAIHPDELELVRYVNAVLELLRADGTWQALFDRWLAGHLPPAEPPAPRYRDES